MILGEDMSYKCEVLTANDPKWYANALRFETAEEADRYGLDLLMRWTNSADVRSAECNDIVNYKYSDDGLERIEA